jgi:hypothetical protein
MKMNYVQHCLRIYIVHEVGWLIKTMKGEADKFLAPILAVIPLQLEYLKLIGGTVSFIMTNKLLPD